MAPTTRHISLKIARLPLLGASATCLILCWGLIDGEPRAIYVFKMTVPVESKVPADHKWFGKELRNHSHVTKILGTCLAGPERSRDSSSVSTV
jgi:hypothetical protein